MVGICADGTSSKQGVEQCVTELILNVTGVLLYKLECTGLNCIGITICMCVALRYMTCCINAPLVYVTIKGVTQIYAIVVTVWCSLGPFVL